MKRIALLGALALAAAALLAGCGTAPDGNPTIANVEFTTGNASLNARLIKVGAKVDQGIAVAQTDIPALCQLAAQAQPVAAASPAILNKSGGAKASAIAAGLSAWVSSATCQNPVAGSAQDAVNLAQTIAQIKAASGGAVTASTIAAQ